MLPAHPRPQIITVRHTCKTRAYIVGQLVATQAGFLGLTALALTSAKQKKGRLLSSHEVRTWLNRGSQLDLAGSRNGESGKSGAFRMQAAGHGAQGPLVSCAASDRWPENSNRCRLAQGPTRQRHGGFQEGADRNG